MSRNITTITKWVPLRNEDNKNLFVECNQLKISTIKLYKIIAVFLKDFQFKSSWKTYHGNSHNELLIEKFHNICEQVENLVENYNGAFKKLQKTLWITKLKLSYFLQQLVAETAFLYVHYGEKMLVLLFKISNGYNQCLNMDVKYGLSSEYTISSNTCPYLMYPLRKISITKLLQILAQNRAELCSHKLIDCLLDTYKIYENHDDDNGSDNSSIEIYRAITKHMSPPVDAATDSKNTNEKIDAKETDSFASMSELIQYEEQNVLDLLEVAAKVAPGMLGGDTLKKSKNSGDVKINNKAKTKVLDYYQHILWGEVANFLEHIILWWGALPLASRPPQSTQHLREWIIQFLPTIEIPTLILSALTSLADTLGMHVTSTSWDLHFRLVLVACKSTYNPENGCLFYELLQNLVVLCNQCEITNDWILGAPVDELPLVEQIPILHRLDHSIHTTRLWAITETKRLANNWNTKNFFSITHSDIINCLTQLSDLKLANHTAKLETTGMSAHVQVCANMREKLVSEVVANHQKLKDTRGQCIDTLAKICRLVSLANLQMIFPEAHFYRRTDYESTDTPSGYVNNYLDEILTPVLATTNDYQISNMILKIMCESWLDYIYMNKVKFSLFGAHQLLTDFKAVDTWLVNCSILSEQMRKKMLKNEVLRRCQGVGKLLLRSPGEHLKMDKKAKESESPKSDSSELMPPEMYVPNQEQWLELRAHKRRIIFNSTLCCGKQDLL